MANGARTQGRTERRKIDDCTTGGSLPSIDFKSWQILSHALKWRRDIGDRTERTVNFDWYRFSDLKDGLRLKG